MLVLASYIVVVGFSECEFLLCRLTLPVGVLISVLGHFGPWPIFTRLGPRERPHGTRTKAPER